MSFVQPRRLVGRLGIFILAAFAPKPLSAQCPSVESAHLIASDAATNDRYGSAVAIDGDTLVIGANQHRTARGAQAGAVYVYVRYGDGQWLPQAQITAADGHKTDLFGYSVAIAGDTILIGARYVDLGGLSNAGAAYVFVRASGGTTWTQQAKLTAADAADGANFGCSVALSGNTAVIGAFTDSAGFPQAGSAYVFARNGSAWSEQAKLVAADGAVGDELGYSVALDGDTAAIAAFSADIAPGTNNGAVYLFARDPGGSTWSQQQKLIASQTEAGASFGAGLAISGDTLIAGAPFQDGPSGFNEGAAYVYVRSGAIWEQRDLLAAPDPDGTGAFGLSVALAGSRAMIAAPYAQSDSSREAGTVYVFDRSADGTWEKSAKLSASDGAAFDVFGSAVATSGDTLVIGAENDDTASGFGTGSSYVFEVNCACAGDIDMDRDVDLSDLGLVLGAFGAGAGGDADGDGDTDLSDLGIVFSNYGQLCP